MRNLEGPRVTPRTGDPTALRELEAQPALFTLAEPTPEVKATVKKYDRLIKGVEKLIRASFKQGPVAVCP